jgi:hypothetical protein
VEIDSEKRSVAIEAGMDSKTIRAFVHETLAQYHYQSPPPGSTVGTPWSAEYMSGCIEKLREVLVEPYLQRFELRETDEQVARREPRFAEYWVVAESGNHLLWYDPGCGEFGLGQHREGSRLPLSIGVRGDLVGVFGAM